MEKTLFLLYIIGVTYQCQSLDYCPTESFQANCSSNHVVMMKEAVYGRMELGRCIQTDIGYLGCSTDVLGIMDSVCSGYQDCVLGIPNIAFDRVNPCGTQPSYLEADYECVDVHTSVSAGGCDKPEVINVKYDNLPIASNVIWGKQCDKTYTLRLHAKPGQKINIQFVDFGWNNTLNVGPVTYGYLADISNNHTIAINGGEGVRKKHLYKSQGHQVKFIFDSLITSADNFLIYYQAGCPQIEAPEGATVNKNGNTATVSCNNTLETWYLTCVDNKWIGSFGTCDDNSHTVRLSQTWHGRVEIQHNDTFGSVCDDNWTDENCKVVCKQLKFRGGEAVCCSKYGPGTGPIWLDHVSCDGTEEHLHQCEHTPWGVHNCEHSEDASCRCRDPNWI